MLSWVPRHVAASVVRYNVGKDGITAHGRWKGKNFKKEVADFGECVWFLKPRPRGAWGAAIRCAHFSFNTTIADPWLRKKILGVTKTTHTHWPIRVPLGAPGCALWFGLRVGCSPEYTFGLREIDCSQLRVSLDLLGR